MDGTAIVLCEGAFGTPSAKTAHGLVRYTDRYRVLGVIDSPWAGKDAGEVLDGQPRGIPVFRSLEEALQIREGIQYLVIGFVPRGGRLREGYRPIVGAALRAGLHVDSGLHQFLGDDPEFARLAGAHGVRIRDVRRPPSRENLHFFTGTIQEVPAVRIAVLGTDSAVGKRTTALTRTPGLKALGCRPGLGGERPQAFIRDGQGAPTQPAYPGGVGLIVAGRPQGIVLQHAPRRRHY